MAIPTTLTSVFVTRKVAGASISTAKQESMVVVNTVLRDTMNNVGVGGRKVYITVFLPDGTYQTKTTYETPPYRGLYSADVTLTQAGAYRFRASFTGDNTYAGAYMKEISFPVTSIYVWTKAATVTYSFFRIAADATALENHFLNATAEWLEETGQSGVDRAQNPKLSFVGHPGIWKVTVDVYERELGGFVVSGTTLALLLASAVAAGIILAFVLFSVDVQKIAEEAEEAVEDIDIVLDSLEAELAYLDQMYAEGRISEEDYVKLRAQILLQIEHSEAAKEHALTIIDYTEDVGLGLGGNIGMILILIVVIVAIGALGGRRD